MTTDSAIKARLEELRGAIRAENISYGEIAELQGLAQHIEPGDVELLEWAGVPEFPDDEELNYYGQPIIPPDQYSGAHVVNPMSAGNPPCCSCGWTPHGPFTMADHLADMGDFVNGVPDGN